MFNKKAVFVINNNVFKRVILKSDNREPAGHGFKRDYSLSISERRENKEICCLVINRNFIVRDITNKNLAFKIELLGS